MSFILFIALLDTAVIDLLTNSYIANISTDYKGTAFSSLVSFILDENGSPIVLISDLALHTKNIKVNPKCSIMMFKEDKDNIFNSSRITFIGKAVKIDKSDGIKKLYLKKYKDADVFVDMEDFSFYKIEIEKIYWVGGFGDIKWIKLKSYKDYWRH